MGQNFNRITQSVVLQKVKFSRQASCAAWTHSLAAQTAAGWTEEDSGPSFLEE